MRPVAPSRSSRLRTGWHVACVLATAAVVGALAVTMIGPWLLGAHSLVVETGSMSPAIDAGDLVVVRDVDDPADIATGDIVTYQTAVPDAAGRAAETLVTHRVVGLGARDGELMVTTQGDTNDTPDAMVPFSDVRGKLWYTVPKAGYVTVWIQQNSLLLLGVAAAIWACSVLADRRRAARGQNSDDEARPSSAGAPDRAAKVPAEQFSSGTSP